MLATTCASIEAFEVLTQYERRQDTDEPGCVTITAAGEGNGCNFWSMYPVWVFVVSGLTPYTLVRPVMMSAMLSAISKWRSGGKIAAGI